MSSLESKSSTSVVYLSGFKKATELRNRSEAAHQASWQKWQKWYNPPSQRADVTSITMHFDQVRVVNRYVFVSLDDVLDKNGEPLEIQIPMAHIKRGKKFLSRGRNYHNDRFTISGPSIGRVAFFCR